jgi:hypothetical protein
VHNNRKKLVDDRLAPCIIRIKMSGRRPKIITLDPSNLMGKSVKEIDADLSAVYFYVAMALGLRQAKATPADPPPPTAPAIAQPARSTETVEVTFKPARRSPRELPKPPDKPLPITWVEGSNVHTAYTVIDRYPRGVDSLTLREEFGKAYQADDVASLSKAMHRLKQHRYIVPYKKRLFTYGRLKQFLEDLQTNAVEDIPDAERVVKGKWATTVFEFIRDRNGDYVSFAEIVDHITKQKDFESLNNVGPQVAVALKKLQYHQHLIEKMKGRGKGLYRLKTEDSKEHPSADIEPSATTH